jgi:hypothetical protein
LTSKADDEPDERQMYIDESVEFSEELLDDIDLGEVGGDGDEEGPVVQQGELQEEDAEQDDLAFDFQELVGSEDEEDEDPHDPSRSFRMDIRLEECVLKHILRHVDYDGPLLSNILMSISPLETTYLTSVLFFHFCLQCSISENEELQKLSMSDAAWLFGWLINNMVGDHSQVSFSLEKRSMGEFMQMGFRADVISMCSQLWRMQSS